MYPARLFVWLACLTAMPPTQGGEFVVGNTRGHYCTAGGTVPFVVWADNCTGVSSKARPDSYRGALIIPGVVCQVPWEYSTRSGRAGVVIVDGSEFELAKGRVVIVSTRVTTTGATTTLRQLDCDVANLVRDHGHAGVGAALRKLSTEDPNLRRFVEGAGKH